ncbi:transposase family protein [Streptomyces sp. GD-15H]|uniref:transposase family protein n=1 Tax=Streptomyces sp. GD-15H TaxID=3129112 RepID=UPI00324C7E14
MADHRSVDVGGVRLTYQISGPPDAPPLVLLHALGEDATDWEPVVPALARAEGVSLRIDGTETQVRRPKAHRPGRCAFVSGEKKQDTMKTTTISDGPGRTLWSGADRPGRTHAQTAMRTEVHRRAVPPPPRRESRGG